MPSYALRPTCRVVITHNSVRYDVTHNIPNTQGAITGSQMFGQPIAGGSIRLRNLPFTPAIKDLIEIFLGYDGNNLPVFTGFVVDPQSQSFPRGWTLQFKDILWIADFPVQASTAGQVIYDTSGNPVGVQESAIVLDGPGGTPNNVPANDAIMRLLRDWAGIPEFRIQVPTLEQSPGVPWVLGTLSPVVWSGVSPLQACQQICETLGYWLFADYSGFVRAVKMSGAPAQSAYRSFVEGVNITVPGWGVQRNVDQVYNRVIVTGATTLVINHAAFPVTDRWQTDLSWLPPGKYRDFSYSNQLIEYVNPADGGDASCTSVAQRLLLEHSRSPVTLTGRVKGDPGLAVGQTEGFQSPRLDYASLTNFFLYGISWAFGGGDYTMDLTLDGGVGSEGYTLNPPPIASFTYTLLRETVNGVDTVDVFVVGSGSAPSGGLIVSWTWTCTPGTPASGTGQRWATTVPYSLGSVVVSLVVTDTNGKTSDPYPLTIDLTGATGQPSRERKISFAAGSTWFVTPDGGATWRSEAGTTIAVPPIGAGGDTQATANDSSAGLVATRASGLRSTKDLLATASTALAGLPATPLFIWQHERNPLRVWACSGSKVYLSTDGGAHFDAGHTPPVPSGETDTTCRWVVESATQIGVIDVLAGRYAFTSFDAGATWGDGPVLTGDPGAIARCYASGQAKHWVGYTGVPSGASPLKSIEGDVAAFPTVTPVVTDIRAVTIMVETPELFAFDAQGRIWRGDVQTGTMTQVGTMPNA
jgi:hypothetical protein